MKTEIIMLLALVVVSVPVSYPIGNRESGPIRAGLGIVLEFSVPNKKILESDS
jgi:hypothetical protein